jgi:hypothetical protein
MNYTINTLYAIAGRLWLALSKREQERQYLEDCRRKAMIYFIRDSYSRQKRVDRMLEDRDFDEIQMIIVGAHARKRHYEAEMLQDRLDTYRKQHYV